MNAFPRLKAYFHIAIALIVIGYPMYLWALWDPMDYGFTALRFGGDFFAYYEAAVLALRGYVTLVMDFAEFRLTALEYAPGAHPFYEWVMSPGLLLFLLPLASLPFMLAYGLVAGVGVAALVWCCRGEYRSFDTLDFVCLAPATLLCVLYGQPVLFVAALLCLTLRRLEVKPVLAGLMLGLSLVEPVVFVFGVLALLASRNMIALSAAVCSSAGVVFLSTVLFGAESWYLYWDNAVRIQFAALLSAPSDVLAMSLSVSGALVAANLNAESVMLVQAFVTLLCAFATFWLFWKPRDPEARNLCFAVLAVLASPFAQVWDLVVVVPLLYYYAIKHEVFAPSDFDSSILEPICFTMLYLLPFAAIALTSHFIPVAPLVLLVALLAVLPRLLQPVSDQRDTSNRDAGLAA